jgi:hypothetical protein
MLKMYTDEEIINALRTSISDGLKVAEANTGIRAVTIRSWAKRIGIKLPIFRKRRDWDLIKSQVQA